MHPSKKYKHLIFTGFGTGVHYSFQTNFSVITAELEKEVTVQTKQGGIQGNHEVIIDVNP